MKGTFLKESVKKHKLFSLLMHRFKYQIQNSTTARTTLQKTLFYLHKPEISPPLVYFKDFQSAKGLEMVINQFTIICVQ